jgi:hypothetical protein
MLVRSISLTLAVMALVAVAYVAALFIVKATKGATRAVAPYSGTASLDNYMERRLDASLRQ